MEMIKRFVRHYTGKMVKTADGKEFESSYYYIELINGKRIYVNINHEDSKTLARLIAEDEH